MIVKKKEVEEREFVTKTEAYINILGRVIDQAIVDLKTRTNKDIKRLDRIFIEQRKAYFFLKNGIYEFINRFFFNIDEEVIAQVVHERINLDKYSYLEN